MNYPGYKKYNFSQHNGYLVDPRHGASHSLCAIGHTAGIPPWSDPALHFHARSEEYYLLVRGELHFLVGEVRLDLNQRELLLVPPGVPHAIVGGEGMIEHFGIRAPALEDKIVHGEISADASTHTPIRPELNEAREMRLSLKDPHNQNCWLLGRGTARVHSEHISLAYLSFPDEQAANAGIGTRHRLHYHKNCWEYYLVLAGEKTLQVGNELVTICSGELLEVPPGVPHTLHSRGAPFEGLTLRAPVALEDKVEID